MPSHEVAPSHEVVRHGDARTVIDAQRPDHAGPADAVRDGTVRVSLSDLVRYRAAVADLLSEVATRPGPDDLPRLEAVLAERLAGREISAVLRRLPGGALDAQARLRLEIRDYRPNNRSSARDLTALIRIYLLSRIDVLWWGHLPGYRTDTELRDAPELIDLEPLRRAGLLRFRYRRQTGHPLVRTTRAVERRIWPHRRPPGAGLRSTWTRPEAVALLNQLAVDLARRPTGPTPPLWVTSLTRSLEHQHRLRALGYAAMLPSGHCLGYAMDVEMSWFRRFDAHGVLTALLRERQGWGDVNVIDEGQSWHICVSPRAAVRLRRDFLTALGG
ncbi:hypothetical protein [Plantactinospora sonchi]|uniref:Uncharacterized protein n=1 Tax=Plantactinospora sonchi TaxID=1544735 RepID=A0ABU7RT55_9ACTN